MLNIAERKRATNTTKTAKTCPECKSRFYKGRKDKKFCSRKCYFRDWARKHPRIKI